MPTPFAARLLPCLLGLVLLGLPSSRAQGTVPAGTERASQVARCLKLRRDAPPVAAALAESLLREADLTVEDELKTLSCLGIAAGLSGDRKRAVEAGARMERLVLAHPELALAFRARAYSQAGSVFHGAGQIHRAEAAYLRVQDLARQLPADEAALFQATTLSNIGLIHADYLDSPEVADGFHRKALAIAASVGLEDPAILHNHVLNLVRLGRTAEALAVIDQGEAMAHRRQALAVVERLRAERAGIWIAQGRLGPAQQVLTSVIRAQQTSADTPGLAGSLAKLSNLQRIAGDPAAALATVRRAWSQVDGFLAFGLMNELRSSSRIFPEMIGVFAGPAFSYVDAEGYDSDSDNMFGLTVGLDMIFNRNVYAVGGADLFDDDDVVYGMAGLRF